jgi:hypothetical protein
MDIPLIVSLIGSGTAIVVAVVTAIFQRTQARQISAMEARQLRKLQLLEANLRREDELRKDQREHQAEMRSVYTNSFRAIQRMRDELALIEENSGVLLAETERARLLAARDDLLATYEANCALMPEPDRRAFHEAKRLVIEFLKEMERSRVWRGEMIQVNARLAAQISELRNEMLSRQQILLFSALTFVSHPLRIGPENAEPATPGVAR